MPTLLFGILFFQAPGVLGLDAFPASFKGSLLVLITVGTFGIPSIFIYYLFKSGYIPSLYLDNRLDRRLPYFVTGIIYSALTFLFATRMQLVSETSPEITVLLGSITLSILIVGIISLYWKISAHSVGIGGVLGTLIAITLKCGETDLIFFLALFMGLAGLIMSARLHLNAHTLMQVNMGLLLGIFISILSVWFLL
ncbi:MAG: hypothetical protein LH609_06365 [Rudanella sp.]|nr:hypothetical protein [Rudanella sp.]